MFIYLKYLKKIEHYAVLLFLEANAIVRLEKSGIFGIVNS